MNHYLTSETLDEMYARRLSHFDLNAGLEAFGQIAGAASSMYVANRQAKIASSQLNSQQQMTQLVPNQAPRVESQPVSQQTIIMMSAAFILIIIVLVLKFSLKR